MKPKNFKIINGNGNSRAESSIEDAMPLTKSGVDRSFPSETRKVFPEAL